MFFPTSADKYSNYLLFFQNEQKHSTLTLTNNQIILVKFYSFLNPIHKMEWNFYELVTTFEFSHFQISLFTTSK